MSIVLNGTTGVTTPDITSTTSTLGALTQALDLGSTGQIQFPATQNASSNANTLDDYEEGTFTPTISAATSGVVTYNSQSGKYTKIGNAVSVVIEVSFNKNTAVGNLSLGGLPFANNSSFSCRGITFDWFQPSGTAMVTTHALLPANGTSMPLYGLTAANADGTGRAWVASDISSLGYCQMTFTYLI